jgi:hypothetical protein
MIEFLPMIKLLLSLFVLAPAMFGQDGPVGFYGCNGYDPNGWAKEAGSGECVVASGRVDIPHGVYVNVHNLPRGGDTSEFVKGLANVLKAGVGKGLSSYLGPLAPIVADALGNEATKYIDGRIDPRASCQVVAVKLPAGAKVVRATFWDWWQNGWHEKTDGAFFEYGKWEPYAVTEGPAGPVLWSVVKNWSHDINRPVTIHVIYEPANMNRERQRTPGSWK